MQLARHGHRRRGDEEIRRRLGDVLRRHRAHFGDEIGGGASVLGLPPVAREVIDVLMLRSAGSGAAILPAFEQIVRSASEADDAVALDGATALIMACCEGHAACAQALLQAGADPKTTCNGYTALMVARENGHEACAVLFQAAGTDSA